MIATDISLLRKIIAHDAPSGKMTWLPRSPDMFTQKGQLTPRSLSASFNTRFAGTPALDCLDKGNGYLCGNIFGKRHQAHRVLWALEHGEWPEVDIDHINGIRHDNRIVNLRSVTKGVNMQNTKMSSKNTSGFNGVYWAKDRNKWRAEISVNNRNIKIGSFDTLDEAINARMQANLVHWFHPNHGKR